jgi:hypothetical protein
LCSTFVTFHTSDAATQKRCNMFYLSAAGQGLSAQAQIGERVFPDQRVDNIQQFYSRLMSTIGTTNSNVTINLTMVPYTTDSFIYGTDFEAVPGQAHGSGMSTHGAQLTFDLRDLGSAGNLPTSAYCTCWFDSLIEITQDGVSYAT